jgi:hypothetical protein
MRHLQGQLKQGLAVQTAWAWGVGLRRPLLAGVGSIQIKSNAAVNAEQVVFSNIAVYTHARRVGRDPRKEADGKTTRERLRDCYLSWSIQHARRENRSTMSRKLCNILLLDFFPESTTIWNIWENKLALVESEGIGAVVATER